MMAQVNSDPPSWWLYKVTQLKKNSSPFPSPGNLWTNEGGLLKWQTNKMVTLNLKQPAH